jgi:hypothetical protein
MSHCTSVYRNRASIYWTTTSEAGIVRRCTISAEMFKALSNASWRACVNKVSASKGDNMKRSYRYSHLLFVAGALAPFSSAPAQQALASASAQTRTQAIAASFAKSKHVVKEKRGVRTEKYKRVESVPVVKPDPQDYSATYEVPDLGFAVQLRVNRDGSVEGAGYEPVGPDLSVRRSFTLRNGRIDGALLTATQVYANGTQNRFEGAFMNRTSFDSPADKGFTIFGLGVIGKEITVGGNTFNRFFYELKQ